MKVSKKFVADFETTTYKPRQQKITEVWAWAIVELGTNNVKIGTSIDSFFDYIFSLKIGMTIFFHNLKFDGSFIIDYLERDTRFHSAFNETTKEFKKRKDMLNGDFSYLISNRNTTWYNISLKWKNKYISFNDSLKILPFTVRKIGKDFETGVQKGKIDYSKHKHANEPLTKQETEYIKNDVLIVAEALNKFFKKGHNKFTIGSNCIKDLKISLGYNDSDRMLDIFPDLSKFDIDEKIYGSANADEYIRKSYKGGWCYLAKGKENKVFYNGLVLDVNSLYPSMMESASGNIYPYGKPHFWTGNYIPDKVLNDKTLYYFIRIKTRFYIKPNKLPCIQIKGDINYCGTDYLETSDIVYKGKAFKSYLDIDNKVKECKVILTLTMTDFQLIKEHYDLIDFEILDGCYFKSTQRLFDEYIYKWKNEKINAKNGSERTIAKLFLNNCYGKLGTSKNSSFKTTYIKKESNSIGFKSVEEYNQRVVYVAGASAVTSYARNFTIRAAQQNYYGANKRGFIYADTDSLHLDLSINEIKGVTLHDKNFQCWKHELTFDKAIYIRQKRYIEHDINGGYNIICAGMGTRCKELLSANLEGKQIKLNNLRERKFMKHKLQLSDIKTGLKIPSKLYQRRITGGVVLYEDYFTFK